MEDPELTLTFSRLLMSVKREEHSRIQIKPSFLVISLVNSPMLGSAANAEDVDTTNNTVIAMADLPDAFTCRAAL